jgi:uncharacterized protein
MTDKIEKLREILSTMEDSLIAYSGGVDSTLLLKITQEMAAGRITAVIVDSPTLPRSELNDARKIAADLGIQLVEMTSREIDLPDFLENSSQRCYFCKDHRYQMLKEYAKDNGFEYILDGSNFDDLSDHRPGQVAAQEQGIRSPLQEAGLTKAEIRGVAQEMGLSNWDKPSSACLASRIPYGTKISTELLDQVDQAEFFLKELGLRRLRVRHHGEIARIEVPYESFDMVILNRTAIISELDKIGFTYITLDIKGFRSGSMNEVI